MKRLISIAVVTVICPAVATFAGSNKSGGGNSSSGSGHSSSSAQAPSAPVSTAGPRSSGGSMPHYSQSISYRPAITYRNGSRTLNYPAVGVSNVNRGSHSNVMHFKNGNTTRVIPRGARSLETSSGDFQRPTGKLPNNTGFQRKPGNMQNGFANLARKKENNLRPSTDSLGSSARDLTRGERLQHAGALNISGRNRLDPQTSERLRHWNGNVSSTREARQNHWNNCQHHHDHHWWKNHCVTIIFWNWGWWGWYDGWWYPAWGYDPYSYYDYNEPIYGYGDLSPDQVVASVQVALQERGYYTYAVDGQMGPITREAIARFQRDHRLPITYGIDPATLGSLGVIR